MLHELFLVLAGHTSPLFAPELPSNFPLISPSERALLNDLARLGTLHRRIRASCDLITAHHPSTIARAVACGIVTHLQQFRTQVTDIEKSILSKDTLLVGAYNIVPLAKILSLFSGWRRTLDYLDGLTKLMQHGGKDPDDVDEEQDSEKEAEGDDETEAVEMLIRKGIKGAKVIDRLREDIHTGYPTIETLAIELLNTAELAWLRQVSTWILYGRLPTFGSADFMIRQYTNAGDDDDEDLEGVIATMDFALSKSNVPRFLTTQTATSILFIGRALHQIRIKGGLTKAGSGVASTITSEKALLQTHLAILQELKTPLNTALFQTAIKSIRDSLSRNTLQLLLPTSQIADVVHILRDFYLLGRGEFSLSLVEQAEESIRKRMTQPKIFKSKSGTSLGNITVKEGEVGNVLKRTWAALSLRQSEEETDEKLERARDVLYLTLQKEGAAAGFTPGKAPVKMPMIVKNLDRTAFNDLLLGVPITLGFNLNWPMELFLTPQDLEVYQYLFHYLLSIRRAQMKLQALWQGRRVAAVQGIATKENQALLKSRRETLVKREKSQRTAWATANLCIFFLESLGIYFQSNVIDTSFAELEESVGVGTDGMTKDSTQAQDDEDDEMTSPPSNLSKRHSAPASRAQELASPPPSRRPQTPQTPKTPVSRQFPSFDSPNLIRPPSRRPDTPVRPSTPSHHPSSGNVNDQVTNPETLALAHQRYLRFICQQTFLTDTLFTNRLRTLLEMCEVLVTHTSTLIKSNEVLDLVDLDDSVEMTNELEELIRLCKEIRGVLGGLVRRLHEIDEERDRVDQPRKRSERVDLEGKHADAINGKEGDSSGLRSTGGIFDGAGIDKLLMKLDFATLNLGRDA